VYQVDGRFFQTIKYLFCGRVLYITGRMMWVWEAVEIDGTSEEEIGKEKNKVRCYTVKDVWLDKDSYTEKDNLNKIFAALNDMNVDHCKWDTSINMINGESLKSIINHVLCSKQYNQYIMGIKYD